MTTQVELTTAEAAEIAGVSDRTIRNWIKDGLLEAKHTPGGRFVTRDSVLEVLREKGYAPPPVPPVEFFPHAEAKAADCADASAATPESRETEEIKLILPKSGEISPATVQAIVAPYVEQLNKERERSDQLRGENRDLAARVGYLQAKVEATEQQYLSATTVTMEAPEVNRPSIDHSSTPWWRRIFRSE